jgi:hypothetical protein
MEIKESENPLGNADADDHFDDEKPCKKLSCITILMFKNVHIKIRKLFR